MGIQHLVRKALSSQVRLSGTVVDLDDWQHATDPTDIDGAELEAASLPYGALGSNEIQHIIDIPILGGASQSVAADAVGTPAFDHVRITLPAEALKHLKSASLIVDYVWAPTADGTIQLYDATAVAVRGESSAKTGGESSEWEEFSVTGLVAGNTMQVRVNITAAGAAGETVTLYRAILRLVLGVS